MTSVFQFMREYRLEVPGHPSGASCGRDGPTLGPVPLLVKTEASFSLRPVEELNELFSQIFARPMDCRRLLPGLCVVARALNEGDLALAMIATTQLRLPTLSEDEASRAAIAVRFEKASPDDPDHPGWPKGTPDGLGGKFRPKEEAGGAVQRTRRRKTEAELLQLTQRALIREALLRVLSPLRAVRLLGEAATNAVPGLNVAADIAIAADIAATAADFAKLKVEADAALEFIAKGPYTLEDLLVDTEDRSFSSFDALKKSELGKFYGPAGLGYQYHHIVEQEQSGAIPERVLNSSLNVVRLPTLLHEAVFGKYARTSGKGELSLRQKLRGNGFDEQFKAGVQVLRDLGIVE